MPLASETAHVIDDSSISLTKTWSSSKINSMIADAGFKTEFVNELPATGDIHTIYFVPSSNPETQNVKDEFMWTGSAWEQVGSTEVDLTNLLDDNSVASNKTWSSEKINSELEALAGDANSEIVAAETIDVTFTDTVPSEAGTEGQYVIYTTEAEDTLYKYENNAWEVQTIDANKLYFDTENNVLYSYKSATHKFAEVGVDNTIIFSGSITSNAAKTALNPIKTPGVYNVLQHQTSSGKTKMTNWVMTVTFLDSDEADEVDGSVYQKLENNYTVYKRYYKPSTDTWTSMTKYYEGLVRDALTSSAYYTWSVNKIKTAIATAVAEVPQLTAGNNISIEDGKINALGYKWNSENWSVALNPYQEQSMINSMPAAEVGFDDLELTGVAGATTYSYSGTSATALDQMGEMFINMYGFGFSETQYGIIASIDTANRTVTFDRTLSASSALLNAVPTLLVQELKILFSGAANVTTYSVDDGVGGEILNSMTSSVSRGLWFIFENFGTKKVTAIDTQNSTITFESTLDADNAISNVFPSKSKIAYNVASGDDSFAEGSKTNATGDASHTEGQRTTASGYYSHAEGYETTALGNGSHAEGFETQTTNAGEHAEGYHNVSHTDQSLTAKKTISSIGCGSSSIARNAVEVMFNGDMYVYGIGNYDGTTIKASGNSIQTLKDVIDSKADAYEVASTAEIEALFA